MNRRQFLTGPNAPKTILQQLRERVGADYGKRPSKT